MKHENDMSLAAPPSGGSALRIEKPWVLIDPTPGYCEVRYFATEAEAVAAAEASIAEARKDASYDGWPEDITGIRVCRVTHGIRTEIQTRPECECGADVEEQDCECEASEFMGWDDLMDVELVAIAAPEQDEARGADATRASNAADADFGERQESGERTI